MRTIKTITLGVCAAVALMSPVASRAAQFELLYNGTFNAQDSLAPILQSGGAFAAGTPFTLKAWFDTSSPNLAPPSPPAPPPFGGFRAYNPSLAIITVLGRTYLIDPISIDPTAGMTVAIFDKTSFSPGLYGVGILQNPPADGAGFIADFSGASPDFTVNNIVSTMFTGYNGVGYGSGICIVGSGGNCQQNAVTPFVLTDAMGQKFDLTLGNYDENAPADPINTVSLIAVPEPATFGFAALALIACGVIRRKRK